MKTTTSVLAIVAALAAVPACTTLALAAGPFNETQARQKVEGAGYTRLSGLHENGTGDWMGEGDHGGRIVMFVLDTKGNVTQTAQNGPATAQAGTADVKVTQAPAQVTVKQAQPDVTVIQGQPTVTVHQPAPIVTVEIPQPEITVHMPKPSVAVSMAQPQVDVNQPKPQVQVMAMPQAQVNVQRSAADVNLQQSQNAPQIQYSADQAKVTVKQATAAPAVKVVQDDDDQPTRAAANATAPGKVRTASAETATMNGVAVSKITNLNIINMHGDVLGDVEQVVKGKSDGKDYVVIGHGGFLGLGQKHVALPLDKMVMRGNKLEMRGLTDDEIRSMRSYGDNDSGYTQLDGSQTVQVSDAS